MLRRRPTRCHWTTQQDVPQQVPSDRDLPGPGRPGVAIAPVIPDVIMANEGRLLKEGDWLPPWWGYVDTPPNFSGFIDWVRQRSRYEVREACTLPVVYHRFMPEGGLAAVATPIGLSVVTADGYEYTLPKAACRDRKCKRCELQTGGWTWRWIGPWTRAKHVLEPHCHANYPRPAFLVGMRVRKVASAYHERVPLATVPEEVAEAIAGTTPLETVQLLTDEARLVMPDRDVAPSSAYPDARRGDRPPQ